MSRTTPLPQRRGLFEPTEHLPGSDGKVRVLAYRARHGFPLWHPDDARLPDGSDPTVADAAPTVPDEVAGSEAVLMRNLRLYVRQLEEKRKTNGV